MRLRTTLRPKVLSEKTATQSLTIDHKRRGAGDLQRLTAAEILLEQLPSLCIDFGN
jgi:hypothetical protein